MNRLALLTIVFFTLLSMVVVPSCKKDDDDSSYLAMYQAWADTNEVWLNAQKARTNPDGTPYFKTVVPAWNPDAYVLIHQFNDPAETAGNLMPMSTSTVDTRYILHYCNDVPIDSSYNVTTYGNGIFRTKLNAVITGWTIGLETMHVGDSVEMVVPYQWAYGLSVTSGIMPYSNLRFNLKLVDIPFYEKNPK